MKRAWRKVESLIRNNAQHRKGFRLQDVKPPFILEQAQGEFNELRDAPDDPTEMADLLGVLIHYSIKQGWTMELLESYMLEKFAIRFEQRRVDQEAKP